MHQRVDRALQVQQRGLRRRPIERNGFQPQAVALGPHPSIVKHDPVTHQHLCEPVLRARQIHPQHLARADQITQRLLLGARDPDRVQPPREQQPGQVLSVTAIVLDPVPARTRNLRRCRDNALDPTLGQLARQRVPRRARLIGDPDRPRQTRAERGRTPVLTVHPKELQLARIGIKHRRDDLRRVHVQTNEGSSLRHGWFLLCGCGPPRGYQPRGTNNTPTNTAGEPAPSTAHSGQTDTPYGLGSTTTLRVVDSSLLSRPAGLRIGPLERARMAGKPRHRFRPVDDDPADLGPHQQREPVDVGKQRAPSR